MSIFRYDNFACCRGGFYEPSSPKAEGKHAINGLTMVSQWSLVGFRRRHDGGMHATIQATHTDTIPR